MGLPGDKIQMKSGKLFINGSLVIQEEDGFYRHIIKNKFEQILEQKKERLNEDKSYAILNLNDYQVMDNTKEFVVPNDKYFVMGDNRDNSNDSTKDVGFVPRENFFGRADYIWMTWRCWGCLPTFEKAGKIN